MIRSIASDANHMTKPRQIGEHIARKRTYSNKYGNYFALKWSEIHT